MSRRKLDARQFAPEAIPYLPVTLHERVAGVGIAPEDLWPVCTG